MRYLWRRYTPPSTLREAWKQRTAECAGRQQRASVELPGTLPALAGWLLRGLPTTLFSSWTPRVAAASSPLVPEGGLWWPLSVPDDGALSRRPSWTVPPHCSYSLVLTAAHRGLRGGQATWWKGPCSLSPAGKLWRCAQPSRSTSSMPSGKWVFVMPGHISQSWVWHVLFLLNE